MVIAKSNSSVTQNPQSLLLPSPDVVLPTSAERREVIDKGGIIVSLVKFVFVVVLVFVCFSFKAFLFNLGPHHLKPHDLHKKKIWKQDRCCVYVCAMCASTRVYVCVCVSAGPLSTLFPVPSWGSPTQARPQWHCSPRPSDRTHSQPLVCQTALGFMNDLCQSTKSILNKAISWHHAQACHVTYILSGHILGLLRFDIA